MNSLKEFERAVETTGEWRIDTVNGRKHYVSVTEEGRAMIGPQAQRRRGWRWPVLKRKKASPHPDVKQNMGMYHDGDTLNVNILNTLPRITLRMNVPPAPPQAKMSRRHEFLLKWQERFYCKEWHEGIKRMAVNVIMWAVAAFVVVLAVKGSLWLISL